jgi:hypothetical protein
MIGLLSNVTVVTSIVLKMMSNRPWTCPEIGRKTQKYLYNSLLLSKSQLDNVTWGLVRDLRF